MGYFDFDFPHTHFYDSDLREILKYVRNLVKAVTEIDGWVEKHEKEYEELKKICDNLNNGTLTPALEKSLRIWVNRNIESLIGYAIKMVFFGITDDGYFVAYIPESWNDIVFNTTGLDITIPDVDYGHLVLSY